MPLREPDRVVQFQRAVVDDGHPLVFPRVPLPPEYFRVPDPGGARILFKPREDGTGCLLAVSEEVQYIGSDAAVRACFAGHVANGWRLVAVVPSAQPEEALRQADVLLGLDGRPPRVPKSRRAPHREIVVKREDLQPDRDAGERDEAERFGRDLVAAARLGELAAPLFRAQETEALIRILSKQGKNAACLVGAAGTGKTAVVDGLALRVAEGRVPATLAGAKILDVNLGLVAAGASHRNEFEGRMKQVLDLARGDRSVILFFDELHMIRLPGSDASQMVKSDLGRGRIRCIGATTHTEYRGIEADPALARRFQPVPVQELTPAQSIEVLRSARARLERHHGVTVPDDLLAEVVDLVVRHVPERHLPDKALDLLDEACAHAALARDAARARREGE